MGQNRESLNLKALLFFMVMVAVAFQVVMWVSSIPMGVSISNCPMDKTGGTPVHYSCLKEKGEMVIVKKLSGGMSFVKTVKDIAVGNNLVDIDQSRKYYDYNRDSLLDAEVKKDMVHDSVSFKMMVAGLPNLDEGTRFTVLPDGKIITGGATSYR